MFIINNIFHTKTQVLINTSNLTLNLTPSNFYSAKPHKKIMSFFDYPLDIKVTSI